MVSPVSGLSIGGSIFTGKKGVTKKDHSTWAGSVEYSRLPFRAQAEYASSKLDKTTETGWYGEVSYRIRRVTPFVRYGIFDPDDSIHNDNWTVLVYGIDYTIQPNLILKLENRQFGGDVNNPDVPGDYKEFAAAITAAF